MERGEFAEIDHTADLGLDLSGATPAAVLEAAQRGLVHVLFGETPRLDPEEEREVALSADTYPELLKAWLEALYRLLEEDGFVPLRVRFDRAEPAALRAVVAGATPPRDVIGQASELKAVTYHELAFERTDSQWTARVIFDV